MSKRLKIILCESNDNEPTKQKKILSMFIDFENSDSVYFFFFLSKSVRLKQQILLKE